MPVLPPWFVYPFAALFGAVWASFLNVVIVRLPRGESVAFPASHCFACGAPIRAYDNIPVLSYLILRGRCRACGAPFSPRYAIIEALGGIAGVAAVATFGFGLVALGFYVFLWLLLGISAIDLEHWIIPHELSWTGIGVGLAFSWVNPRTTVRSAIVGAVLGWLSFTAMSWLGQKIFHKEALGLGDRWLLAMEAAFLGGQALLPIVLFASLQGSIVGLLLIVIGRAQSGEPKSSAVVGRSKSPTGDGPALKTASIASTAAPQIQSPQESNEDDWVPPKNAIPFGPFLALGALEWLFFGPAIWSWYYGQLVQALG